MQAIYSALLFALIAVPPLIFFTALTRNPYYFQIILLEAIVLLLWALRASEAIKKNNLEFQKTPVDLPFITFFSVISLSWLVSLICNYSQPNIGLSVLNEGLKRWIFIFSNMFLVYYAARCFVTDKNRNFLQNTVFLVAFFASVYGILQYFGIELFWPQTLNPFGNRCVSTFGNPNFFSSYLVLVLPIAVVNIFKSKDTSNKLIYLLLSLIYLGALLCTLTRSSWIGFAVSMVTLVMLLIYFEREVFKKNLKFLIAFFGLVLVVGILWPRGNGPAYSSAIFDRLTEAKTSHVKYYGSITQRQLIWSCAWNMAVKKPVLGVGFGCFELFFPYYQGRHLFIDAYKTFRTHANNAHNEFLEILSQSGFLGLGVYLWFLVALFSFGISIIKNTQGQKKFVAIGLLSSLVGMLADNMLNVSLHFAVPAFLYWWNAGLLTSITKAENLKKEKANKNWQKVMLIIFIILCVSLLLRFASGFIGEINYFQGYQFSQRGAFAQALPLLEKAHSYQKTDVNNNYELANTYAMLGLKEKALEMYNASLNANAGYDEIYYNEGIVYKRQGKDKKAINAYTSALRINPMLFEGYNALGGIFVSSPVYESAGVELYKQYALISDGSKQALQNLSVFLTRQGRNKEAAETLKELINKYPDDEQLSASYSSVLAKAGMTDKETIGRAAKIKKIEEAVNLGHWDQAKIMCEKFLSASPESLKVRFYLANIYYTLGKVSEAISQYKLLLLKDASNELARTNLSVALAKIGNFQEALKEIEYVVKINPNNKDAVEKADGIKQVLKNVNGNDK